METKWENVIFKRIDADIADNLIDVQEAFESVLSKEKQEELEKIFGNQSSDKASIKFNYKGLTATEAPVVATRNEMMRRMKDMASMGGNGMQWYAQMPDEVNITINTNHSLIAQLLETTDEEHKTKLVKHLVDISLLSQGLLKGEQLSEFMNRNFEIMAK
jgi:molecular chaperone HtpG